jgi:hypothetical protein
VEEIDGTMARVIGISEESTKGMEELAESVDSIRDSTDRIAAVGAENAENISIVEREVSRFRIVDASNLKAADGQDLIQWNKKPKNIPPRPNEPRALPETDRLHWYDLEYAGWKSEKVNLPESRADGSRGKRVVLLESCDHPYHVAYRAGCLKMAEQFGVRLSYLNAAYSTETQALQVDEAIPVKARSRHPYPDERQGKHRMVPQDQRARNPGDRKQHDPKRRRIPLLTWLDGPGRLGTVPPARARVRLRDGQRGRIRHPSARQGKLKLLLAHLLDTYRA